MKAINNLYNESYKQLMQWKLYTYTMKAINNLYNENYKQLMPWKLYKQHMQWKL